MVRRHLLFLFFFHVAFCSFGIEPQAICPLAKVARNFLELVPIPTLVKGLEEGRDQYNFMTKGVTVTNSLGEKVVFRFGEDQEDAMWATIHVNNKRAAYLMVYPLEGGKRVYLKRAETLPEFRDQHAFEALLSAVAGLYPGAKTMDGSLAWTNMEVIANALAGRTLTSTEEQFTVLRQSLSNDKISVLAAVNQSPTGKAMKNLGFDLSSEVELVTSSEDKKPMLVVSWVRKPI